MPPLRLALLPLLLPSPVLLAHDLAASEVKTVAVSLSDEDGEYSCGLETSMIVPGPTENDLNSAVQVQTFVSLTEDEKNVAGLLRIRVVRMSFPNREPEVIGFPFITEATLSSMDGPVSVTIGPDLERTDDAFFFEYVDIDAANRLNFPIGNDPRRQVSFRDSITNAEERMSYSIVLPPSEMAIYQKCMQYILNRGERKSK